MKKPPTNKIASAYKFKDRLILYSQARTSAWFYISCEPYLTRSRDASTEEIGWALQTVVASFRAEIPQPTNLKDGTANFIRGIGAKSNKKIQEGSIYCGINEQDGIIHFEPSHNGGTSGDAKGFQPIIGAKYSLPLNASPSEIGAGLLKGFALCTTIYELP
jgi:hypothetical protein